MTTDRPSFRLTGLWGHAPDGLFHYFHDNDRALCGATIPESESLVKLEEDAMADPDPSVSICNACCEVSRAIHVELDS